MPNVQYKLKQEAFDEALLKNHHFVIAKDTGRSGKVCTSFKTIDDFLKYSDRQKTKNFYEIIQDAPRLEYYDIDEPKKPKNSLYWKNNSLNQIVDDFVKERQNWINSTNFNIKKLDKDKELYVLVSEKPEKKKSIHIVIRNGFVFRNLQEHREYINDFKKYLDTLDYGFEIDYNVYSKDRCFRIIDSSKINTDRVLIRSDYNKISLECDRRLFFITYLEPFMKDAERRSGLYNDDSILSRKIITEYIPMVEGFREKEKYLEYITDENTLNCDTITKLFDAIHVKRWDDYNQHMYLIYLGKKLGLSDKQIHTYCKKSEKYIHSWVQQIIDNRRERCDLTIDMVYRYLRQDYPKDVWEKVIPKDNRFEDYMAIPKKKRTQEQKAYINDIIERMNDKNISVLFKKPTHTKYVNVVNREESIKYVEDLNILFKYGRSIGIKSCMGSGKTTACINYISTLPKNSRIVIVSPRITFSNAITAEYNNGLRKLGIEEIFTCYLDVENKKRTLRRINRVVVSMESLHLLTELYEPDLVVIDECQANLCSHISNTNGNNLDNNLFTFKEFIKNKQTKVIWADAFLNEKTIQFINDLEIDTFLFIYNRKMEERIAYKIPQIDTDLSSKIRKIKNKELRAEYRIISSNWYKLLMKKLDQGKKVFFPCTTRDKVESVEKLFNEKYGDSKKALFYKGKQKGEKPYDFSNINESWTECDLVCTTTTITVGLNYDVPNHFDCIIMYFSNRANNLVVDMFQTHYRVRHIKDLELYYYESSYNLTVKSKGEITWKLYHKEKWYNDIYAGFQEESENYIKNLVINDIYERELSRGTMNPLIERFLIECNYTLKEYKVEDESEVELESEDDEDNEEDDEDIEKIMKEYENIKYLTYQEYVELENTKYSRVLTNEEEQQIQKWYFMRFFYANVDPEFAITSKQVQGIFWYYTNQKYRGVMKTLSNMRIDKALNQGDKMIEKLVENEYDEHGQSLLHKDTLQQIQLTRELAQKLGLKHINDTETPISDEIIRDVCENWKSRYEEIVTTMNLRVRKMKESEYTYKSFLELLKNVLGNSPASMCKFEKTENKRIKIKGKITVKQTYNMVFKEPIIKSILENNPLLKIGMKNIPIHVYNMLGFRKVEPRRKRLLKNLVG